MILFLGICLNLSFLAFGQSDEKWGEFQKSHLKKLIDKNIEVYKDEMHPFYSPLLQKIYQEVEKIDISKYSDHIQSATDRDVDNMTLELPEKSTLSCLNLDKINCLFMANNYIFYNKISVAFRFPNMKLDFYPMSRNKKAVGKEEYEQLIKENYTVPETGNGAYISYIKGKHLNEFITISPVDNNQPCPKLDWIKRPVTKIYYSNDKLNFSFDYNRKLISEVNVINKTTKQVLLSQVFSLTSPSCKAEKPQKHTFIIPKDAQSGQYQLRVKIHEKGKPEPYKSILHDFRIKQRCIDSLAWASDNMKKKYQEGDYVNVQFNVNNDEPCLINRTDTTSYQSPPRTNANCLVGTRIFSNRFPIGKHKISITAHGNKTIIHKFKVVKKLSNAEAKKRKIRRRLWGGIGGGSGLVTLLTILLTPNRNIAY